MFGVAPHEYEEWPARSRGLAEALIELDASSNEYGIPLQLARDIEVGFDVKFVKDYSVEAVKNAIKTEYGEKGLPDGVRPVVTINEKAAARRRSAASQRVDDDAHHSER